MQIKEGCSLLKLLIVDDEPVIVRGLETMVREGNTLFSKIEKAEDGMEALKKLAYFQPDLIITDIQMPGMNGLQFIEEAKRKGHVRIIILTGYDNFTYAHQAMKHKVTDYLLKPINEYELLQLLSEFSIEIMKEKGLTISSAELSGENKLLSETESRPKLLDFFRLLEQNYLKEINLTEMANHLNLHPNYLCALLKKDTGTTFVQHVQQYRISKAKELLLHTDCTIDQIAKLVCFQKTAHFFKVFKQLTGITPGRFRETKGERNNNGSAKSHH
jgi:two-component system response regulator YesN